MPVNGDDAAASLKARVAEVTAGKRPLSEVTIDVAWARKDRNSLTVFGSGVGLWNREKQFVLTKDEHKELLVRMERSGLFDMPQNPKPTREEAKVTEGPVIMRSVSVRVGDLERTVFQTNRVWTLPALETLVSELFGLCEKPATKGIGASDLPDGLEKIAKGKLAPEVLSVVVNIPPLAAPPARGYVVMIEGGVSSKTVLDSGQTPAPAMKTTLPAEEVRSLARLISERRFAGFPGNLSRENYADVRIQVLSHVKSVQARKFAGLDPGKYQPEQKALEEIIGVVLKMGTESRETTPKPEAKEKPAGGNR